MQNNPALEQYLSSDDEQQNIVAKSPNMSRSISDTLKQTVNTLSQLTMNISYNFKNSGISFLPNQRKPIILNPDNNQQAWILGKKYQSFEDQLFRQHFQKTIWMSYRKGMNGCDGDAGWGCMIRVSQMLMAQIFTRIYKQMCPIQIISLFRQDQRAPFSFKKICELGNIQKRWTNSLQLFPILQQLEETHYLNCKQQNKKKLNFQVYNNGIKIQRPSKFTKYLQNEIKNKCYPKLIVISNRVGIKQIPQKIYPHIKYLMSNKNFVGAMGGVSRQALYILGYYENRAIILDPHYVQQSQNQFSQIYFSKTPRGILFSQLSPSLTFCYYLENDNDHVQWARWLVQASLLYDEYMAFQLKVQQMKEWVQIRKTSDQFEEL